jgi:hypothetical protein
MDKPTRSRVRSKSESMTSVPAPRSRLFDPAAILEGEDAAAYAELDARVRAAVAPADVIEEMLIADVVSLQWEVLRWRRLNLRLLQAGGLKRLERFVARQLDYDVYKDYVFDELVETFRQHCPADEIEDLQMLARKCAEVEREACDEVMEILMRIGVSIDIILDNAENRKAKELVQGYMRREPAIMTEIQKLITDAGKTIDSFMADALAAGLDTIERIDRLTTIAESRRNAALREIERRRIFLGETLRQNVQEIENSEFKLIETASNESMSLDK